MHGCGPAHVSGCAHLFLREHPHRMTHASRVCTLIFGRAFQQSDIHAFMEAFMLSCFHGSTVATFMESFMLSWKHSGNFHGSFQLSWKHSGNLPPVGVLCALVLLLAFLGVCTLVSALGLWVCIALHVQCSALHFWVCAFSL